MLEIKGEINYDKKVKVYRNLNKNTFSIVQNNKVVAYSNKITLKKCKLNVRQGGNKRVKDTGLKNVHAFVEGFIMGFYYITYPYRLSYNPHNDIHFNIDGRPDTYCSYVSLSLKKQTAV